MSAPAGIRRVQARRITRSRAKAGMFMIWKNKVSVFGGPRIWITVYLSLYWGPLALVNFVAYWFFAGNNGICYVGVIWRCMP